jgi:hypoxanthine phosphoribosyltransferase
MRTGLRVLVVDDERDTVTTLKAIPDSEGHAVEGVPRDEVPP